MPQDPYITAPKGVRDAIASARDQVVRVAGLGVPDLPPAAALGASRPLGLELEPVPVIWGEDGRGVELAHHVVSCGANIEVEPPVDVVVVDRADARILYGREPEARADGPIIMEAPPADIPIPACFQLANYNNLLSLNEYPNTEKIARICSRFKDGLCGRGAPTDSWSDICPICLDHAFLELPVAERATGVAVVLDVEDRGVGPEEHEFATIPYILELNARSVCPRGCSGPDHEKVPERGTTSSDGDLELAGSAPSGGVLVRAVDAAVGGRRHRQRWSPVGEPRHGPVNHVHANDLMAEFITLREITLREKTNSDGSLHTAIREFRIYKRRHGAVGKETLRAYCRTQIMVLAQDLYGFFELFIIRQRLVTCLGDLDRSSRIIETSARQHHSIVGVVVGRGAVAIGRHWAIS